MEWCKWHYSKSKMGKLKGVTNMSKKEKRIDELQAVLLNHFDDKEHYSDIVYRTANDDYYSLSDLIARQWINNGCDGFGMVNISKGYDFIIEHLDELKALNMISESAKNNSGITLWKGYNLR